jgi:hypothetical protein
MTKDFKEIDVPNPEKGLSEKQRDRLRVDMANGINHLVVSVDTMNGKVKGLTKEIYGEDDYQGTKACAEEAKREAYKNTKFLTWLTRILILSGILGGTVGITQLIGG